MTVSQLRTQYPRLQYKSFSHHVTSEGLQIEFEFELDATHRFKPTLTILNIAADQVATLSPELLDAYVFNLGMVELLSYWKTTCSPEIVISAGSLDVAQIAWWQDLLIQGLGEFFFVNQIEFTASNFVTISSTKESNTGRNFQTIPPAPQPPTLAKTDTVLIPVGGGKDSVVTLELLKDWQPTHEHLHILHLNPAAANQDTAKASGLTHQHYVRRQLDPLLREMNADGFLNGHTPFSALLAFLSTFVAHLNGHRFVVVSNEHSSNEGNVVFHGREINHQYSKSFAFEQSFQAYATQYLPESPWYFSLLRPWYELQIARIFAQFPEYHSVFRSCNRGKKTNSWCGECSKCLFAYLILQPFIDPSRMETLFGKNLLADLSLLPIMRELVGYGQKKPLECVGTSEESLVACYLGWQKYQQAGQPVPALLAEIQSEMLSKETHLDQRAETILSSWNSANALPTDLAAWMERKPHYE